MDSPHYLAPPIADRPPLALSIADRPSSSRPLPYSFYPAVTYFTSERFRFVNLSDLNDSIIKDSQDLERSNPLGSEIPWEEFKSRVEKKDFLIGVK
jgi:hypothetical protein